MKIIYKNDKYIKDMENLISKITIHIEKRPEWRKEFFISCGIEDENGYKMMLQKSSIDIDSYKEVIEAIPRLLSEYPPRILKQ